MKNGKELIKSSTTIILGLIAMGTVVYSLAIIHAEVRANTKELAIRRESVYSVPLINERLAKIPSIERDVFAIKLSLARIEAKLGVSSSLLNTPFQGGRFPH